MDVCGKSATMNYHVYIMYISKLCMLVVTELGYLFSNVRKFQWITAVILTLRLG